MYRFKKHQNRVAVIFVVCHGDMSRNVRVEIRRIFAAILADPLGLGESQTTPVSKRKPRPTC